MRFIKRFGISGLFSTCLAATLVSSGFSADIKSASKASAQSSLDAVFGTGGAKTGYTPRLAAARKLAKNIDESEVRSLLSFLQKKLSDEPELSEMQLGAIKIFPINMALMVI